jgi:predicted aspartyl protease
MLRPLLTLLAAIVALPAAADCQLNKIANLHVEIDRNQITVPGQINGHPVRFLLDVSSPGTLVTAPAAQSLGLAVIDPYANNRPSGAPSRLLIGTAAVDEMLIDRLQLKGAHVTVRSLRDNYGEPQLVALVGNDFLGQFDIEIDLKNKLVSLYKPQGCENTPLAVWGGDYARLDLKPDRKNVQFTARVNDHDLVTILDTGSPFSALTESAAGDVGASTSGPDSESVDAAGATDYFTLTYDSMNGFAVAPQSANLSSGGDMVDNGGGPVRSWRVKVASVQLDQEIIRPATLRVNRYSSRAAETGGRIGSRKVYAEGMILGVDFLLSHHAFISRSQNKIYFSYAGGPAFQGTGVPAGE